MIRSHKTVTLSIPCSCILAAAMLAAAMALGSGKMGVRPGTIGVAFGGYSGNGGVRA